MKRYKKGLKRSAIGIRKHNRIDLKPHLNRYKPVKEQPLVIDGVELTPWVRIKVQLGRRNKWNGIYSVKSARWKRKPAKAKK